MSNTEIENTVSRNFLSYNGIKLPLKLVTPLGDDEVENRNTYYRGIYNSDDRMIACEKVVYGEIEQEHRYEYHDNGALKRAEIIVDEDDITIINYDEQGLPIR